MRFWRAKVDENNQYVYEVTEIAPNVWTNEIPYAIQQRVFIQDYSDNVSFSWVGDRCIQGEDGAYKLAGLEGGYGKKAIKCWMPVAMPFEDFDGWNSEYIEDPEKPKKHGRKYLLCIEDRANGRTTYSLFPATWDKNKWVGVNTKDPLKSVIAWREYPSKSRKKWPI